MKATAKVRTRVPPASRSSQLAPERAQFSVKTSVLSRGLFSLPTFRAGKALRVAIRLAALAPLLAVSSFSAAFHFVSPGSSAPTPPYSTWATAATNIKQAVDAAASGDVVIVTNGVYTGGLIVN